MSATTTSESLPTLLRALKLPAFLTYHAEVAEKAEREGWSFVQYLQHLVTLEVDERRQRRIQRNLDESKLPPDKTLDTLDVERFPAKIRRQIPTLCEGGFTERAENLLAFGLPGRGKTHLCCAIGALTMIYSWDSGGADIALSHGRVGWDAVGDVGPNGNFMYAVGALLLGAPTLIYLNATQWRNTGGY